MPNPLGDTMNPPVLAMASAMLDDLELVRIANENRLRQLVRVGLDKDDLHRGFELMPPGITVGEDEKVVDVILFEAAQHVEIQKAAGKVRLGRPKTWDPFVWQMCLVLPPMIKANNDATKNLEIAIQDHPMHEWIKEQRGLGDKQVGRLLACIGDPYWHNKADRPRGLYELWAYCGYSVTEQGLAPARKRGVRGTWSPEARMRLRMISESCMKSGGPFRTIYDDTKLKYAEATHHLVCVRCGPSGAPAQPDSPLSKNHIHARALRKVSKEVLRGLWREARRIHLEADAVEAVAA